mmetsp:Transcript_19764/g.49161  ORF Transcript_19764/g.49161 Transcript_19764/m.49161 type:complete len:83 (+) Transcript_19764:983-1231(+)
MLHQILPMPANLRPQRLRHQPHPAPLRIPTHYGAQLLSLSSRERIDLMIPQTSRVERYWVCLLFDNFREATVSSKKLAKVNK